MIYYINKFNPFEIKISQRAATFHFSIKASMKRHNHEMKEKPLVSVIIPTYNYASYLAKAIQSCIEQSYQNLEIFVIDDGSTDNTQEIVEPFKKVIHYIFQKKSGVSAARNKGLEEAKGDFIAFLDADDYLTQDSIEIRLAILLNNDDIGIVFAEKYTKLLSENTLSYKPKFQGDLISDMFYQDMLLKKCSFATATIMIRAAIAKQFTFPVNITNGEDIAYFTKIFYSAKGYYLAKPVAVILRHQGSARYNIENIKKQHLGLVDAIFDDPYYKGTLNHFRKEFTSNRCLSISRILYLCGDKKLARTYYLKGIFLKPTNIFKINYFSKFLKTLF